METGDARRTQSSTRTSWKETLGEVNKELLDYLRRSNLERKSEQGNGNCLKYQKKATASTKQFEKVDSSFFRAVKNLEEATERFQQMITGRVDSRTLRLDETSECDSVNNIQQHAYPSKIHSGNSYYICHEHIGDGSETQGGKPMPLLSRFAELRTELESTIHKIDSLRCMACNVAKALRTDPPEAQACPVVCWSSNKAGFRCKPVEIGDTITYKY